MFVDAILNVIYIISAIFGCYVTNVGLKMLLGKKNQGIFRAVITDIIFVMFVLNVMITGYNRSLLCIMTGIGIFILCSSYELVLKECIKAVLIMWSVPSLIFGIINSVTPASVLLWQIYIASYFITLVIFSLPKLIEIRHLKQENESLIQQNTSYRQQLETLRNDSDNVKTLGHDLKNHISVLIGLYNQGEYNKMKEYLDGLNAHMSQDEETDNDYPIVYDTGNFEFDAIINKKLEQCKKLGIETDIKIIIPENINIEPTDMAALAGNLFDNSIRAVKELDEAERRITVEAKYNKDIFYIKFSNRFEGRLIEGDKGELLTTRQDDKNHGIGLLSVKRIAEKYDGDVRIKSENNCFEIIVMLYPESINTGF